METQTQERSTVERQTFTARLTKSIYCRRRLSMELAVEGMDEFPLRWGSSSPSRRRRRMARSTRGRTYCVAAAADATFDLCLNRVDEWLSVDWLCDLEEGATVKFHGCTECSRYASPVGTRCSSRPGPDRAHPGHGALAVPEARMQPRATANTGWCWARAMSTGTTAMSSSRLRARTRIFMTRGR